MAIRKIIEIDSEKCDGCGECIVACPEGALAIVGGKAKLVRENFCDGFGACIGECPRDAIRFVEREAEAFDEAAAQAQAPGGRARGHSASVDAYAPPVPHGGCPSSRAFEIEVDESQVSAGRVPSRLGQWPVQLMLLSPGAPFLRGKKLVLIADCVAYAFGDAHREFIAGNAIAVACPKLDDPQANVERLAAIFERSGVREVEVVRMEVPCCGGLVMQAESAIAMSGAKLTLAERVISVRGTEIEFAT